MTQLVKARHENRLEKALQQLVYPGQARPVVQV